LEQQLAHHPSFVFAEAASAAPAASFGLLGWVKFIYCLAE
jgi:hypothetical protein